ncbi:uncharacterized protein APUU_12144A [Aspergillus puulaauensis]|uniref:Uncharacterized protein n=1 Tax=Aspergillus puulaauensis TaxID=1220207 RepID=A0A7R8AHQ8_9EURO|nr:uncharacterized protein APUU_12144A [Aspergillus puulaauensis]BCS19316.1 hypothetical protein APUU_12144A [Aspergillus puulaauensis]
MEAKVTQTLAGSAIRKKCHSLPVTKCSGSNGLRLAPGRSVSLRLSDHPHHIMDLILSSYFLRGGPSPPETAYHRRVQTGLTIAAFIPWYWHGRLSGSISGLSYSATVTVHIHILRSFLPEPCQTASALLPPV